MALYVRRHRQVWFNEDSPIISSDSKLESPERVRKLVKDVIASLEEIALYIEQDLPLLKEMQVEFEKAAARKAKRKTAKREKTKKKASRKR